MSSRNLCRDENAGWRDEASADMQAAKERNGWGDSFAVRCISNGRTIFGADADLTSIFIRVVRDMVPNDDSAHVVRSIFHSGRFLHEAEVEANQKQPEMNEAANAQKVRGHRSKSKERKRQGNRNMIPRQIPACSSRDKKCAGQKLKNILPDAFHAVT
jgi:hypothetical protein